MKRIILLTLLLSTFININSQTKEEVVRELTNVFNNVYNNNQTRVEFNEPYLYVYYRQSHKIGNGYSDGYFKFNIKDTRVWYRDWSPSAIVFNSNSGIYQSDVSYYWDNFFGSYRKGSPNEHTSNQLDIMRGDGESVNRISNAIKLLVNIMKNNGTLNRPRSILDDTELVVEKIEFTEPSQKGVLKVGQSGCISVTINNKYSNKALNAAIVVKEVESSNCFEYDQYTTIDEIEGNGKTTFSVPIKANTNAESKSYKFHVSIKYGTKTLKDIDINIGVNNPAKQSVSTNHNKTIRMRRMGSNTYSVSCSVNGLPLDFIFDTGASTVTLSKKQALFMLKNGYLKKEDIKGKNYYSTANGDISVGTVINLRKINISGLILTNVEAAIIDSDNAPLLLGQSALKKLGKVQIDYKNSTLTVIR